jgi:IS605 OrfB family transposase
MKFTRSAKCSIKFATKHKKKKLKTVLSEYGRVCYFFIQYFWNREISKAELLKDIVNLPETWLSARLRKVAAREAIDMIQSVKQRWKNKPSKIKMPIHKGKRMCCSSTIADLQLSKNTLFDAWLHLSSIGNKTIINIPIKYHRQFNKWNNKGKRLNAYTITPDYVQFVFEIETQLKKTSGKLIGIDTGIKALASTSDGKQFGKDVEKHIKKIKRCKYGSKNQKRRRNALKQYINETVKEIINENLQLIVVEKLKNLNYKTKFKRRLNKNMRRSLGSWNYRYWLNRLQQATEENRVSFRSVPSAYTSQRCSKCGHIERGNRKGEVFKCLKCDHSENADINAAINILQRFLQGHYGALYKPKELGQNVQV